MSRCAPGELTMHGVALLWRQLAAVCSWKTTLQVLATATCIVERPRPLPFYFVRPCNSHSPKRLMSPRHAPQRPASVHAGVFQATAAAEASPSAKLPASWGRD